MFHIWMDEWREKGRKARLEEEKNDGWTDELYS